MIDVKFTIRTFIKGDSNRVTFRVRWNSKKNETAFVSGVCADPNKWDVDAQKAKRGTVHVVKGVEFSASDINVTISTFKEAIEEVFETFANCNRIPTTAELKAEVNRLLERDQKESAIKQTKMKSFQEMFDEFLLVNGRERNWDSKCKEKYTQAYHHFTAANPNIKPNDIDLDSMFNLRDWYVTNNYKNRTVNKQVIMLKTILKWIGQQKGYHIPDEVLQFKTNFKVAKKTVTFLNFEELTLFTKFRFEDEEGYLAHARDLWCFMAYTSLRYSDLRNLKTGHIVKGHIDMITQKTTDRIHIPLTDAALGILKKYEGKETADGHVFNVPSNQKLNDYVKEAAKIVGLDRIVVSTDFVGSERNETQAKFYDIISCHDARRTFVSCSLALGIPPEVVMKCTGHTGYSTMKPYIETACETQTREMEKWNRNQFRSQVMACMDKMSEEQLKILLKEAEKLATA